MVKRQVNRAGDRIWCAAERRISTMLLPENQKYLVDDAVSLMDYQEVHNREVRGWQSKAPPPLKHAEAKIKKRQLSPHRWSEADCANHYHHQKHARGKQCFRWLMTPPPISV